VTEDRYLSHNCNKQQIDNANVKLNKNNTNALVFITMFEFWDTPTYFIDPI